MPLILWAAFILVASLMPNTSLPQTKLIGIDKIAHILFYFVFALLDAWGWKSATSKVLFTAVGYGILIEVLQHTLTSDRQFDIWDIFANSVGVMLFIVLKVYKSKANSR